MDAHFRFYNFPTYIFPLLMHINSNRMLLIRHTVPGVPEDVPRRLDVPEARHGGPQPGHDDVQEPPRTLLHDDQGEAVHLLPVQQDGAVVLRRHVAALQDAQDDHAGEGVKSCQHGRALIWGPHCSVQVVLTTRVGKVNRLTGYDGYKIVTSHKNLTMVITSYENSQNFTNFSSCLYQVIPHFLLYKRHMKSEL